MNPRLIPALTLQPAWARAVSHGVRFAGTGPVLHKTIELRTWSPPAEAIGQDIAIHASASVTDLVPIILYCLDKMTKIELGQGRVVAIARLVAVRPTVARDKRAACSLNKLDLGPRRGGRILLSWVLENVRNLDAYADDPRLKMKGATGRMTQVDLGFLPKKIWK